MSDVVPIVTPLGLVRHSEAVEDLAADILGLELSRDMFVEGAGGIVVLRQNQNGDVYGATFVIDWCSPVSWSRNEAITLAHEIGHALRLEHSDIPGNLMHPDPPEEGGAGTDLDEEQIETMRRAAWWLQNKC